MSVFGAFFEKMKGPTGGAGLTSFSFTVTKTNGNGSFNNVEDIIADNLAGFAFAVHINTGLGCTGFAGGSSTDTTRVDSAGTGTCTIPTTSTPEPASLTALGAALLGLAA